VRFDRGVATLLRVRKMKPETGWDAIYIGAGEAARTCSILFMMFSSFHKFPGLPTTATRLQ